MAEQGKIPFDYLGAKKEGYSDDEIHTFLKDKYSFDFDITSARKSGYSDKDISDYIVAYEPQKKNSDSALETSGNGLSKHSDKQPFSGIPDASSLPAQPEDKGLPMPSIQNSADATLNTSVHNTIASNASVAHAEVIKKATPIAIENAAKRSLKIKGLNPNNAALLNSEKANFQKQVNSGDATVGFGENGEVGLINHPGLFDSFSKHMHAAIDENKNSREFAKMSIPERVAFAKQQQQNNQSSYIKEQPTNLGSLGAVGGGLLPTLALYGAGALAGSVIEMAAPETGGLSNLAMKPVMSFVTNAGSEANKKGMEGTLQRYNVIKQHNPEMSDEEAMAHAGKGEDVDRLAGVAEAALFSTVGGELKLGKSATGNLLKGMAKSGVDVGGKTSLVTGAQDVGHNIEGVTHKSGSEILGDMATTFGENAPMGAALHGFMGVISGAAKVPELIKSALKYDVVTKMPPERVQADLAANVNSGAITPDEADKATNDLNEFTNALKKTHDNSPDNVKASVAGLILKRDNILKGAEGKDKTTQALLKQQTDAIDNQINGIYRTGKPLEHEINPNTGTTFKQPTYDDEAKAKIEDLADRISKGKRIEDAADLQAEANFPEELQKQLTRISKEEKSAQRDKENPNTDLSDNIDKYLKKFDKEKEVSKLDTQEWDFDENGESGLKGVAGVPKEFGRVRVLKSKRGYTSAVEAEVKLSDKTTANPSANIDFGKPGDVKYFDSPEQAFDYATKVMQAKYNESVGAPNNTETQGSITNEGVNQIKQPTERTAEQIKKISREKIDMDNIDKKVTIHDIDSYKSGSKELPLKEVTAFEGRDILRKRLKAIDNIIKCL